MRGAQAGWQHAERCDDERGTAPLVIRDAGRTITKRG
jgi:hypothetical protein